jgi:hypothetical protein
MRKKINPWLKNAVLTITPTKHLLSSLSINVRTEQFELFRKITKPNIHSHVLDVGVISDETLKDSNIFEKLYQHPQKLTAATIEDRRQIEKLYPKLKKVVKVVPHAKLPFRDNEFDIVVSWATLEHTGNYNDQEFFLNELLRVGKIVFVTTPNRSAIYEPHSGLFFLHWLPLNIFRSICKLLGKDFWAVSDNLNPLWPSDIKKMKLNRKLKVRIYKTFKFLPSHIIITG